jgi:manganese/zinc/iron transport system permease protein
LIMVAFGGDGRFLPGLLIGAGLSAGLGLLAINAMTRATRLHEDAAIGAVLSVFFGLGVVILTVIQVFGQGRQAGLESVLLGATAGMVRQDAILIALVAACVVGAIWVLRRPMTIVAFDPGHAAAMGWNIARLDLWIMAIALIITVIGLQVVGLVLVIALAIIPPVAARFWTNRTSRLIWMSGLIGAAAAYIGVAISAAVPNAPTGPVIVLVLAAVFALSFLCSPLRGVVAAIYRRAQFQAKVHRRQGLLALARGEAIHDKYTLRILRRDGAIRPDGVATDQGRAQAAKIARDEALWAVARVMHQGTALIGHYDGLTPIEQVFTQDEIATFETRIGTPKLVEA